MIKDVIRRLATRECLVLTAGGLAAAKRLLKGYALAVPAAEALAQWATSWTPLDLEGNRVRSGLLIGLGFFALDLIRHCDRRYWLGRDSRLWRCAVVSESFGLNQADPQTVAYWSWRSEPLRSPIARNWR
jgi:hypothetical protein